jgi:hypothetical protein
MKKLLLLVILLVPCLMLAEEPKFSGYLQGHDSASFVVTPKSDAESWWFKIPDGDYFWVKVNNADGEELDDIDLSDHNSVTLVGAEGVKVTFRVYDVAGEGNWSAWRGDEKSDLDQEVSLGSAKSSEPKEPVSESKADHSGSLAEGDTSSFVVEAAKDTEYWVFTYPDDASFSVKVMGKGGKQIASFDLKQGNTITLTGGGKFTLKVYAESGNGSWSATRFDE